VNPSDPRAIDALLEAAGQGDVDSYDQLLSMIYDELRMVTVRALKRDRSGRPIPAAGLAQEAFARLLGDSPVSVTSRARFLGIAARVLRELLVEHLRSRIATTPLAAVAPGAGLTDVLAIDRALDRLAAIDKRQSQVVELRYFGGLSEADTAHAVGLSEETTAQDWLVARAWLFRELSASP